ncbi:hypothetical protein DYU11_03355 [Fibrisoma montanum]|uniref:Uncharacterized protein n=1 Tax=Fibrisoma montanum TaxID=2305895 RepID=A0A418MJ32_9BACT|nr:hypothetical protein [Fibrisoma montanum]RIV27363.1 hypothetical protein DYU11_03355 [Fibrisoma montanum]
MYKAIQGANTDEVSQKSRSFVETELNSSTIREIPASTPTTVYNLLSLSPEGQAQLIKSLETKSSSLTALTAQLNKNFSFTKDVIKPNVKIIPKTIKKALVFTVNRQHATPSSNGLSVTLNKKGDRVDYLELEVDLAQNSKASFDSWDKFVTDYLTLNLGKVTSSQQWNATLNVNAGGGSTISLTGGGTTEDSDTGKDVRVANLVEGTAPQTQTVTATNEQSTLDKSTTNNSRVTGSNLQLGAGGSVGFTDKLETALDLSSRVIKLSGTLAENKLILRQESGQGFDLSGNVVVSVDYALSDDWAQPVRFTKYKSLFDDTGKPLAIADLKIDYFTVIYPNIQADITGTLTYNFIYRQVEKGSKHLPEARHKARYIYGIVKPDSAHPAQEILVRKSDIVPKKYKIGDNTHYIVANTEELQFETAQEALAFFHYLGALFAAGATTIPNFTLNSLPIDLAIYKTLVIKTL